MKKLDNLYFRKLHVLFGVMFELLKCLLVASFLTFTLFPLFIGSEVFKKTVQITDTNAVFGITGLVIFVLFVTWKKANNFWWKYKNTYKVTASKFTYVDFIFCVLFFSLITVIIVFGREIKMSQIIQVYLSINTTFVAVYLLTTYLWPQKKEDSVLLQKTIGNETSDEPIQNFNEDILNRRSFVEGLYKEIIELKTEDSFVFGLYGKWGDGKSSVLNLLKSLIKKDDNFMVMSFEPWNFKDEEAMLKAFFNTLEHTLNREYTFPQLKKTLCKYQKLISSGLSRIGVNLSLEIEEETIEEIKIKIEKHIENIGKKLLIVIDEIDRLEPDEISMIFKLVRSNSKFKNSIFLLSLDEEKVADKLKNYGTEYLEKIIQKPICLPKIEHSLIDKFVLFSDHNIPQYTVSEALNLKSEQIVTLFGYIAKISIGSVKIVGSVDDYYHEGLMLQSNSISESSFKVGDKVFVEGLVKKDGTISLENPNSRMVGYRLSQIDVLLEQMWRENKITPEQIAYFDKEFVYTYRTQITNIIENFRDAKRFLNSICSSYPPIASEVSPHDFFCLEVIKVFAKNVYDDIFSNWWVYVDSRFEGDYLNTPFSLFLSSEKDKKPQRTQEHLENLFQTLKIGAHHKFAVKAIMVKLFPSLKANSSGSVSEEDRTNKKICTTSFLKYFTLSTPTTELPDEFFESEFKNWGKELNDKSILKTFNELQKQGKLIEFFNKVKRFYIESLPKKIVQALLSSISKHIGKFSKKESGDIWDSEFNMALSLVLRILNSCVEKTKIAVEVNKILKSTPDLLFAVDLVLTTKKERNGDLYEIYENTDNLAFRKTLSQRLVKYYIVGKKNVVTENPVRSSWIRILYQWGSNWTDDNSPNKKTVTNYIIKLFDNSPDSYFELINSFNSGFPNREWIMNYDEYSKVYELEKLSILGKKFIKANKLNKKQAEITTKFIEIVKSKSQLVVNK